MQFLVFMLSLHSCNHQFVALVIGTEKSAFAHSQSFVRVINCKANLFLHRKNHYWHESEK